MQDNHQAAVEQPACQASSKAEDKFEYTRWKRSHFEGIVGKCLQLCKFYSFLSFLFCCGCCYLVQDLGGKCQNTKLYDFVLLIALYSMINMVHYLAILRCILLRKSQLFRSFQESMVNITLEEGRQPIVDWNIFLAVEKLTNAIYVAKYFKTFSYYVIFLWGNLAYFDSAEINCDENLKNVAFIMISFGYLFSGFMVIGLALAFVSMLLYCPFLLIYFLYTKLSLFIKRRNLLKNLKMVRAEERVPDGQCVICMCELGRKQSIYAPCKHSSLHQFHKQCLSKWVALNFYCPICRTNF